MGLLREDKSNYKQDVYTLINVVSNARSTGRWDVSGGQCGLVIVLLNCAGDWLVLLVIS